MHKVYLFGSPRSYSTSCDRKGSSSSMFNLHLLSFAIDPGLHILTYQVSFTKSKVYFFCEIQGPLLEWAIRIPWQYFSSHKSLMSTLSFSCNLIFFISSLLFPVIIISSIYTKCNFTVLFGMIWITNFKTASIYKRA